MENLLTELDLTDKQAHLLNEGEAGLVYAMKYDQTMCQLGRKCVSEQSCGEKGVTTALLCYTFTTQK
jgi:hypothetical protein